MNLINCMIAPVAPFRIMSDKLAYIHIKTTNIKTFIPHSNDKQATQQNEFKN